MELMVEPVKGRLMWEETLSGSFRLLSNEIGKSLYMFHKVFPQSCLTIR